MTYKINRFKDRYWEVNGKLHRIGGPAVERVDGTKEWWVNGKLHRTDGAAIEFSDDTEQWWVNGTIHREDGPAIIWPNGHKQWFVYDNELTEEQFIEWQETQKAIAKGSKDAGMNVDF